MGQERADATRAKLVGAATDLVRRQGYNATSVDDICKQAGITKGAFFHHYESKEALVEACLGAWDQMVAGIEAQAPFQEKRNPRKRALGYMDFVIAMFSDTGMLKSCLAGTTVQEAADTNPRLRDGANACFVNAESRFQALLDSASKESGKKLNTASLAALWMATLQGSLILFKASQDQSVIAENLTHVRGYIADQLPKT